MFICEITGKQSRIGDPRTSGFIVIDEKNPDMGSGSEKLNRIVVETRAVEYKHWDHENEEHWFSHGTEIVRELNASDEGLRLWDSWTAEQRADFLKMF